MDKETALYMHIPFCKQKCLYCDFPSFPQKENLMFNYTESLCKEIDHNIDRNKKISTIFIGGGTPTYLSLSCLKKIKQSLDNINKYDNIEFTIEGNPDSFTEEKLKIFKDMGVNRISIGLQAWQDKLLRKIGRVHNLDQFKESYNTARSLGFNNINVDLMFGLPNQTVEEWKETLNNVVGLNPEHISCYSLIVEEGTPFYKLEKDGRLQLPDEDDERFMYEYTIKFLREKGYNQYEISNFSKHGLECRHNLTYWNLKDYIGCGMGAHSYVDNLRYRNCEDIEKYIYMISNSNNAIVEQHKNSIEDNMEEFMFMGLRKIEGISIEEFKTRFNKDIFEIYENVINKFLKNKLLMRNKDRIYLSPEGIELSNQVMCEFIL